MIYNLVEHLKTQFANERIYCNARIQVATEDFIPDRCVLVTETGGGETPWFQYVRKTVQILCRDFDIPKTRKLAWDIYSFITSRFGLILPQVVVDGVTYPAIQTAQISAMQEPFCLGADETSRIEFTTNFLIYYVR